MTVRKKVVGRHEDGRKIVAVAGDELRWRYDVEREAYMHRTKDGVVYAVQRTSPAGTDTKGHKLYRYWAARAMVNGEVIDLGDTFLIAWEAKEVCQIYESSRLEPKQIEEPKKMIEP